MTSALYWPHLEFVYECKNLKILVCVCEKVTSDTEFTGCKCILVSK